MTAVAPEQRIDWFRVITDLCRDGGSLYQLSGATGIPRRSLNSYKNGVEPTHARGMCILAHWSMKTGKSGSDAPTTRLFRGNTVR
ncbi:hypothetical protein [Paraburkholderia caribensis]|uniref:hypothetical protein n=1 Tax=Paraburkholderia caribensis TaxID=75105 RepID=UPI001CB324B8|nr:hypothetical protein [Paraburkholderia caribensis]CAG9255953.1 hypothetical protein PCAR4_40180 [Paraburkholderia caribensis]